MNESVEDPSAFDDARNGLSQSLAMRIDAGLCVNAQNARGDSLLLLACYYGRDDCVGMLIDRGADVELANAKGQRPLMGACFKGFLPVVKRLVAAGAEIDDPHSDDKSPLMYAASFEHVAVVRYLLSMGADVAATTADGKTAIDLAKENLAHSVLALLDPSAAPETSSQSTDANPDSAWTRIE